MIIEIDIYPADEPWSSIGYTGDHVSSQSKFPENRDPKIYLSDTLTQIDEFFFKSPPSESR